MEKYKELIKNMNEEELESETKEQIWSSTFWIREHHESHDKVNACYNEWIRRKGDDSLYKRLHEEVKKEYSR